MKWCRWWNIHAPKLAIDYSFLDNSMGAFTKPGAIWVLSPIYDKISPPPWENPGCAPEYRLCQNCYPSHGGHPLHLPMWIAYIHSLQVCWQKKEASSPSLICESLLNFPSMNSAANRTWSASIAWKSTNHRFDNALLLAQVSSRPTVPAIYLPSEPEPAHWEYCAHVRTGKKSGQMFIYKVAATFTSCVRAVAGAAPVPTAESRPDGRPAPTSIPTRREQHGITW